MSNDIFKLIIVLLALTFKMKSSVLSENVILQPAKIVIIVIIC